jgi:hypothetical protein
MSTTVIPRHVQVWTLVIKETLQTGARAPYSKLTEEDLEWGLKSWLTHYDALINSPEALYTGLILANRESAVGKFAVIFNTYLYAAITTRNESDFKNVLNRVPYPELFDNPLLSSDNVQRLTETFKREKLSLNLTIEKALSAPNLVSQIINTETHSQCYKDVCIKGLGGESLDEAALQFYETSARPIVFISDKDDPVAEDIGHQYPIHVWCFNLLQLVALIALNRPNPYTDSPFRSSITEMLSNKYSIEIKMYRRSVQLLTAKS